MKYTLKAFLDWLHEQPDDMKFYDGDLCTTCLVGKWAQQTLGRPYYAYDGRKIVTVNENGALDQREEDKPVYWELVSFVRRFDRYIGVWEKELPWECISTYAGPFDNITAYDVKEFARDGR